MEALHQVKRLLGKKKPLPQPTGVLGEKEHSGVARGNQHCWPPQLAGNPAQVLDRLVRRSLIDVPDIAAAAVSGTERRGPGIDVHKMYSDAQSA
jgi:hypothetical protein